MIKAVNMKNYPIEYENKIIYKKIYIGFGIIDTDTNEFFSLDGKKPYVLSTKKVVQSCIDGGWIDTTLKRITLA